MPVLAALLWMGLICPVAAASTVPVSGTAQWRNLTGPDTGPLYRDTDFHRFPVEPWATYTYLLFLLIIVYWGYRIRRHWREHPMLVIALPILLVGFVGGVLYHATRSSVVFFTLDWAPMALLGFIAAVYFWRRLGVPIYAAMVILFGMSVSVPVISKAGLPLDVTISLRYGLIALAVLLPLVIYTYRRGGRGWYYVTGSVASFCVAILFRFMDLTVAMSFLPMGTHWLWHVFAAFATHLLLTYTYNDEVTPADTTRG